jgi:hypothetical protein
MITKLSAQNSVNWTEDQLMEPVVLAAAITTKKDVPIIFHVGPGAVIPHSIDIGMTNEQENLDKLKEQLSPLAKHQKIVLYCGCCPFDRCPNVRPAIQLLKNMNFSNYYLLNIPTNIKVDWISKGYPSAGK